MVMISSTRSPFTSSREFFLLLFFLSLDLVSGFATLPAAPGIVSAAAAAAGEATATAAPPGVAIPAAPSDGHGIGGLLLQRAVQTQLYYLEDLRDEPRGVWLRGFLGHDHLDARGRFAALDGVRCPGGWRRYLEHLIRAPPFSITVELAPPPLSAQQRRNPYLARPKGRTYEETIEPAAISKTLCTVARSLEREWAPALAEIAAADRARVILFDDGAPLLQTPEAAALAAAGQVRVAGGEGDDQETPLHTLNLRVLARFCTRAALRRAVEELESEGSLLSTDAAGSGDGAAAAAAAAQWMAEFSSVWALRLGRGADDDRRRTLGRVRPGQYVRLCDGADADDVTEALWQEPPQLFAETGREAGRRYSPEALAARLRRARANVCSELMEELRAAVGAEFGG